MADDPSLLDRFAATTAPPPASVPAEVMNPPPRVIGAQQLAVKRDEREVLQKLRVLGAAAGDHWLYRFPVKERRTGKTSWIEGPSIKLANDLARTFGNCEVETRVIDLGEAWIIYARFTDYETGFSMVRPFQQRKSQRSVGTEDSARQQDIALQIGVSKSIRNVVTNALQTFSDFAFDEAKGALVEKIGKDLARWRERTVERLTAMTDIKRVEAVVGRAVAEWTAPDVASVIAMAKSVQDGMATLDETFPPLDGGDKPAVAAPTKQLDEFAGEKPSESA